MRHTFDMTSFTRSGIGFERLAGIMQDYVHPREVLQDSRLAPAEKRAILCFWASDACAVESQPGFRWLPGTPGPILFDHVIETLQSLDRRSEKRRVSTARHASQELRAGP